MGQGCSGRMADAISEVHGHETKLNSLVLDIGNGNSRSSTIWRQQNARRIEQLITNLTRDEFQALLAIFRGRCRLERSHLLTSTAIPSNGNKPPPSPSISFGWKRFSLSEESLFSLFPSVSAVNHAQVLSCLRVVMQQHLLRSVVGALRDTTTNSEEPIATGDYSLSTVRLVSKAQLMRAFHCSTYLYNARDAIETDTSCRTNDHSYTANPMERSNSLAPPFSSASSAPALGTISRAQSAVSLQSAGTGTGAVAPSVAGTTVVQGAGTAAATVVLHKEILFLDFCFALSLCRQGTLVEQLTFLFVLFAEPVEADAGVSADFTAQSAARSRANSTTLLAAHTAQMCSTQIHTDAATAPATVAGASSSPNKYLASSPAVCEVQGTAAGTGREESLLSTTIGAAAGTTAGAEGITAGPSSPSQKISPSIPKIQAPSLTTGLENSTSKNNSINNSIDNSTTNVTAATPHKSRMFSFSTAATPKPVVVEKTQLQMLGLSEVGALKLWLFLQLQLLRVAHPALSLALSSLTGMGAPSSANHSGGASGRAVYDVLQSILTVDWLDNRSLEADQLGQILQVADKLAVLQQQQQQHGADRAIPSRAVLSYADFMQLCCSGGTVSRTDAGGGALPPVGGNNNSNNNTAHSNIFALLQTAGALRADNVRLALQELTYDLLPLAQQARRLGENYFESSRTQVDLHTCMRLLHTDQHIPPAVKSEFAVFALDASWFFAWCRSAQLVPVFYTPVAHVPTTTITQAAAAVVAVTPYKTGSTVGGKNSTSKRRLKGKKKPAPPIPECLKHLVVNLQPLRNNSDGGSGVIHGTQDLKHRAIQDEKNSNDKIFFIQALRNSCLLSKDSVGVFRLRDTDRVVPYTTTAAGAAAGTAAALSTGSSMGCDAAADGRRAYVFLPYELGRQLYLRFDAQAAAIPVTTYRRYLRFASTARPIESSDEVDGGGDDYGICDRDGSTRQQVINSSNSRDAFQTLGPTATQLIRNFNATLEAECDPHPITVPLYLCTPLGVATVAPVDTLQVTVRPPTVAGAKRVCVLHSVHNMFPLRADLTEPEVTVVTLQDLVRQTLFALDSPLGSTGAAEKEITSQCRLWGLYACASDEGGRDEVQSSSQKQSSSLCTVQHSVGTVWRLLTTDASHHGTALSDILSPRRRAELPNKRSQGKKTSSSSSAASVCLGFMIEKAVLPPKGATNVSASPRLSWPTDRILSAQGTARAISSGWGSTGGGAGGGEIVQVPETCPFKIAERVDMLTDTNKWVVGVVTNIAREQSATSGAVRVRVMVRRLLDANVPPNELPPLEKPLQEIKVTASEPGAGQEAVEINAQSANTGSAGIPAADATADSAEAAAQETIAPITSTPLATEPAPFVAPVPAPAPASFKRPKTSQQAPEETTEPQLNPENELNDAESERDAEEEEQVDSDAESAAGDSERVNPALQNAINKNKALEAKRAALLREQEEEEEEEEEGSEYEDGDSYEGESSTISPVPANRKSVVKPAPTAEELAQIEAEALRAANTHSGVTWDAVSTKENTDLIIIVPHTSLRILNLGTMTNPPVIAKSTEIKSQSGGSDGSNDKCALQYSELLVHLKKHMQAVAVAHLSARDAAADTTSISAALSRAGSVLSPLDQDHLSRQGSAVSLNSNKKAPSSGNLQTHRASFFGTRSSVIPLSNDDPRSEQRSYGSASLKTAAAGSSLQNGAIESPSNLSRAGSLVSAVSEHQPQSPQEVQFDNSVMGMAEWQFLQMCMKNANTCPFHLRALYVLLLTERLLFLERGHRNKGTVVLQHRVCDADYYLHTATSTAAVFATADESEPAAPSTQRSDDRSYTEPRKPNAANVVQARHRQRNAFERFVKSCGKSIQHGLISRPNRAIPVTGAGDCENGEGGGNDTSSNSNESGEANDATLRSENRRPSDQRGIGSAGHHHHHHHAGTIARTPTVAQPPVSSSFPQQGYGPRRTIASIVKGSTGGGTAATASNGVRLLGVAGLNNLGNTCFMSSALQCLFRTTPLVSYFLSEQYRYDLNTRSNLGSKGKLTEEFAKFLQTIYSMTPIPLSALKTRKLSAAAKATTASPAQSSTIATTTATLPRSLQYSNLSPTTLLKIFQAHKPQFSGADQQDSQEFLCELLDTFHEDLKLPPSLHKSVAAEAAVDAAAAAAASVTAVTAETTSGSATDGGGGGESGAHRDPSADAPVENENMMPPLATTRSQPQQQQQGDDLQSLAPSQAACSLATASTSSGATLPTQLSVQQQGDRSWARYLDSNSSIVTNLFQGQMCTKVVCKVCNTSSASFEPFTTLSMPIPRLRSDSITQPADLTTVIVTVYRKMPRLSQILRLPDECFEGGVLTQEQLLELYRANRNPVKLALQFPRFANIESVLTKAVEIYNAFEADSAASIADHNSSAFNSTVGTPVTRTGGTCGGGGRVQGGARSFADDVSTGNSYQDLESTAQSEKSGVRAVNNGGERGGSVEPNGSSGPSLSGASAVREEHGAGVELTVSKGAEDATATAGAGAAAAGTNAVSNSETPVPPEMGESATVVTNNSAFTQATKTAAASPPLVIANCIVIDINDKRKGRFGKMLDKRDTLQPLLDEATNECHLILQERCKDITFVAALQASRLTLDYDRRLKHGHRQKSTYFTSLLDYFDASEYDVGHLLYNNFPTLEGPILSDFDHIYDPKTYPGHSDRSVGSLSTFLRNEPMPMVVADQHRERGGSTPKPPTRGDPAKEAIARLAARPAPDYSFGKIKPWPASLFDFQIGDRVDAVDYKGTWYPGSVIDLLVLSERDIKTHALSRYCRDFIRRDGGVQGASNSREPCTPGLHVKVHFDGFKCNWDEWYDQRDFDRGFIAPVYTKASRKLKMHEIPVIQRRLVYTTQQQQQQQGSTDGRQMENSRSATPATGPLATLNIEILDCPSFVQSESYRSCAHLYHHLHEQMLRYVDEDLLLQTVERAVGDENGPFSIRLLSFDNLLLAPIDHYCPVVTTVTCTTTTTPADTAAAANNTDRDGDSGGGDSRNEVRAEVVLSNTAVGVEFSVADRFKGHKSWEGCAMPMDIARPVANIFHNKLAIAVDWFVHVDLPPQPPPLSAGTGVGDSAVSNKSEVLMVDTSTPISGSIAAGLLHEAMLYHHDVSYQHYLNAQRQRLVTAQQAAARLREQQQRDEQLRREAALATNSVCGIDTGSGGGGNSGGGSAGLSAEDALLLAYKNDTRNGLTIEDVLSKFVSSEDIDEYYCNRCRRPTPGKLHSSIHTLPDVLILHLQRLVITSNGGGKIRTLVKFPLAQLDMRPFTTEQKEYVTSLAELSHDRITSNPQGSSAAGGFTADYANSSDCSDNTDLYELYGVVNHIGGMHGGHYTALSRCEEVILQDLAGERYHGTIDPTFTPAATPTAALMGCVDDFVGESEPRKAGEKATTTTTTAGLQFCKEDTRPLSVKEFLAGTLLHPLGTAVGAITTTSSTSGARAGVGDEVFLDSMLGANALDPGAGDRGRTKWIKFDDEFVNAVPTTNLVNSVVTESAYLLFYQRKQLSAGNIARYI